MPMIAAVGDRQRRRRLCARPRSSLLTLARIDDAASSTVLQFVGTFGVWILADKLGLSAIITIVVYAMTIARSAPRRMSARSRVSTYSVWETAVFVLNVLAFVLMGLQARPIVERLAGRRAGRSACCLPPRCWRRHRRAARLGAGLRRHRHDGSPASARRAQARGCRLCAATC